MKCLCIKVTVCNLFMKWYFVLNRPTVCAITVTDKALIGIIIKHLK